MTLALETAERHWSLAEAETAINERMVSLQSRGVIRGSVVCVPAELNADTVWTFLAVVRLGAVFMPTPSNPTAHQQAMFDQNQAVPASEGTCLRLLTSGTTGTPKRVDLSITQLNASADGSIKRLGHSANDTWLCCLPFHHIGGLSILYRSSRAHSTVRLLDRFDSESVNAAIETGVTIISVVPTMLERMLEARNGTPFPTQLRVILVGGAPMTGALLDRCRTINAPIAMTWGMTETASQIATRVPGDLRPDRDVGLPLDGVQVSVENGRLVVQGPIAPGGRYVTADRGRIDEHGRIVVEGRGTALIISGGENIDPTRVEQCLLGHPNIAEACVVGRQDPRWGQRPVAFVVGTQTDSIPQWIRNELPPHERPAEIHWVDTLPRTELGKLNRSALIHQAQSLHGLAELDRD